MRFDRGKNVWACLLIAFAAMVGCEGMRPLAYEQPTGPNPFVPGRSESIVFDSPAVRVLTEAGFRTEGQAWYASRNDVRPTVFAGYRGATIDEVVNVTYDRQSITSGRVRDDYYSTTYRQSVTRTVR